MGEACAGGPWPRNLKPSWERGSGACCRPGFFVCMLHLRHALEVCGNVNLGQQAWASQAFSLPPGTHETTLKSLGDVAQLVESLSGMHRAQTIPPNP